MDEPRIVFVEYALSVLLSLLLRICFGVRAQGERQSFLFFDALLAHNGIAAGLKNGIVASHFADQVWSDQVTAVGKHTVRRGHFHWCHTHGATANAKLGVAGKVMGIKTEATDMP